MRRIAIFLLSVCMILSLCACGQKADVEVPSNVSSWQEQYDLGVQYLSDGNYEEAIIAFTVAIKIDSKRPEAYLGLADAYTGTGDLDAARKALEDGLAATGNTEIQARLDELSAEAGNLTGQPPFSLQDLEDWGYPYGIDAYTLEREGKIETGRIEDLLEDYERSPAGFPDGSGTGIGGKGLTIFVENDMSLHDINIDVDHGDTAEGPRGLYLGMSAEAALNLFQCDNPDAIKYLQSGDENLMTQNGDLREMSLYDPYEDEDNALAYTGSLYLSNQSHYEDGVLIDEEERVILNYEIIELASLHIDVTGGVVSRIDVRYWN